MKRSHVIAVFKKDGLELLRDKRTWFVNIVLPVLLYPVLALVGIQIFQLTQPGPEDIPQIAVFDCPNTLNEYLSYKKQEKKKDSEENQNKDPVKQLQVAMLNDLDSQALQAYILKVQEKNTPDDAPINTTAPDNTDKSAHKTHTANINNDINDINNPLLKNALDELREFNYSAVVFCVRDTSDPQNWTIHVVADNAHRDFLKTNGLINAAVKRFASELLTQRIEVFHLSEKFATPAIQKTHSLASKSESIKTHLLSGFLPVLLVLMAISGAYHPALDLIAGERERGTLETLLSWPSDRHSIFFGKLLVVVCAALIMVVLNLMSLGITAGIATSQITSQMAGKMSNLGSLSSIGFDALALSFITLLPITIIISACSLAIAGIAKSYKEAQTYISPLLMVFMVPSFMCLMPSIRPNMLLDLIPLIGPLVALKSCLQGADMAFVHLAIASVASIGFAFIIVNASIKLLNNEQFLFSGLKNIGWGRFRKWGNAADTPDGIEVILLYALCVGLMMFIGGIFASFNAAALVAGPLIAAIALPTLVAVWLGDWNPIKTLSLRKPSTEVWICTICLVPVLIAVSASLGLLQQPFAPENLAEQTQMTRIFQMLTDLGGIPLLFICVAIVPGICEELLCRGALLSGFKKSLGSRYAIWMSAFLFAALHMSPWRFMPQFILGVFLAIITLRSGSIFPAMVIHAGHNGLIVLLPYILSFVAGLYPELEQTLDPESTQLPALSSTLTTLLIATACACGLIHAITQAQKSAAGKIDTGEPPKPQ